jgi:Ricin-type beta-trefoil lectin domain
MGVAHADTPVGNCIGATDTSFNCSVSATVSDPTAITITVVDNGTTSTGATATEDVTVAVATLTCTDNSGTASVPASSTTGATPLTDSVMPLPATADGQCNVSATVSLPAAETGTKGFVASQFSVTLSYTPAVSSSPSPGPSPTPITGSVHPVIGFDNKCLDDKFNSSANRAAVVIWSCSGTDQAESWRFTSNELIHNNKCLNDQGNGGIRSKVILWTCNGASNEKWSELANGELKLQSHSGTLCLDDPRSSTSNGAQLIVYTCQDSSNQKWKLP